MLEHSFPHPQPLIALILIEVPSSIKAKRLWQRDIWLISHINEINEWQLWVGALSMEWWLNRGRVQRRGVESAFVHVVVWAVSLTGFISKSAWPFSDHVALYTLPCSPYILRSSDAWKPFLTSTVPFSSILLLENRTVAKEKEVRRTIHSFILQTQTHADLIRGKSDSGFPLSSALISSVEQCSLTVQPVLYFEKWVFTKASCHERRTCLTDQPVMDRVWVTAGARQTLYLQQKKLY